MCGINGFNFRNEELIKEMMKITHSRGPDNHSFYSSKDYTVGHNRLSIIDPEERSNQPYYFKNYILSFNGEIFNYLELKKKLIDKNYKFETYSDTEVIIKLFDLEGKESFKKLSGIFSISLYDKISKKLFLIRDIVGVKPLYYYFEKNSKKFIFSSLINSILVFQKNKELNLNALNSYANFNRNDYRETFFKKIFKVMPGELIELYDGNLKRTNFLNYEFSMNYSEKNLKQDLNNYFSNQFLSDVPVALSLSGGIDSNVIFQELLKNKGNNFTNYSVRFENYSELQEDHNIAKKISHFYNTKFHSIEVSFKDFKDNIEKVVDIVEEPIGNQNAISNFILSKNISEKVIFSGDGGDEVFTGYNKYRSIYFLSFFLKTKLFSKFNLRTRYKNLNRLSINNSKSLYLSFSEQNILKNQEYVYRKFKKINEKNLNEILHHSRNFSQKPCLSNVMYHELDTWVPNDILLRNDKIYGNRGIEARVPFLDKNIIENYLMIGEFKKYGIFFRNKNLLLKNYNNLKKFVSRKKIGFISPFASWLRNELNEFGREILSKEYYDSSNIIDLDYAQKLLKKHKDVYCDPYLIWNLISLQIFLRKHKF